MKITEEKVNSYLNNDTTFKVNMSIFPEFTYDQDSDSRTVSYVVKVQIDGDSYFRDFDTKDEAVKYFLSIINLKD